MARSKKNDTTENTDRLETVLWKAADKLRKNIDAAEYSAENVFLIYRQE